VIIEISTDCEPIPNIIILYSLLSNNFSESHYLTKFLTDVPIFTFAAMYSFSLGYYAICQAPKYRRNMLIYKITQSLLVIAWFIFSIIRAGPFDGWTKIRVLSECNLGFSIFLAVV
jgi:hypothetical protein